MKARIFKDGEWKDATKDDFIDFIIKNLNVNIEDLDKVNVFVNDKWVKGTELITDK